MTAAEIVAEVRRRTAGTTAADHELAPVIRRAIENVLTIGMGAPGDTWGEQIVLEAVRLLKEKR